MNMKNSKKERWESFERNLKKESNNKNKNDIYNLALNLKKNLTVATHFGDDLDNRSSIYTLENWAKEIGILDENENFAIERVPAGKTKEGIVNVDTGGHKGSSYDGETIIVDGDPKNNVKSSIEEIAKKLNIDFIPEQILECADAMPTKTSIFDTRSGMSLQKFTTIENVFKMAQEGLLTKQLSDSELKKYNLMDAHLSQQKIVDDAKNKVEKYTKVLNNGEKIVIAPEFIKAGSLVAYESGINYYASVDKHYDAEKKEDGTTFAINAKPGLKLPENIKEFGNKLVDTYKDDNGASGVFLHPNGNMLVAGGPKNPDFKINASQEDMMNTISSLFEEYSKENVKGLSKHSKKDKNNLLKVATIITTLTGSIFGVHALTNEENPDISQSIVSESSSEGSSPEDSKETASEDQIDVTAGSNEDQTTSNKKAVQNTFGDDLVATYGNTGGNSKTLSTYQPKTEGSDSYTTKGGKPSNEHELEEKIKEAENNGYTVERDQNSGIVGLHKEEQPKEEKKDESTKHDVSGKNNNIKDVTNTQPTNNNNQNTGIKETSDEDLNKKFEQTLKNINANLKAIEKNESKIKESKELSKEIDNVMKNKSM